MDVRVRRALLHPYRKNPMHRSNARAFVSSFLALALAAACSSPRKEAKEAAPAIPAGSAQPARPIYFGDLGSHHRVVSTKSAEAQRWFDQGLVFAFAFNHDEAIRSFREAARLDPSCAMAWWGVALCNGPHINNPTMDPEHSQAAWEALSKARALESGAMPVERALIDALSKRYAEKPPEDRGPLDTAYAEAMRGVWRDNPNDADVGSLAAEALMDLHPWDLWNADGTAKPHTPEIVEILEKVLAIAPDHPLANHLNIHALEASPHADRATASADRLRTLVPGAGHLVHMPAHIYARTGRWADAASANERAIEVDRAYRARSPEQGFYHVYMSHNHQFLAWASMMEGRSAVAIGEARKMVAGIPPEMAEPMAPFIDGLFALPYGALMRFGHWDEILKEPEPPAYLPVTRALRHFARGTALASTRKLDEAEAERKALDAIAAGIKEGTTVGNSQAKDVLAIASHALAGEIAAQRGENDAAIAELTKAVNLEDANRYDEPPDWLQPVRHSLGAVLLRAGKAADAEKVYREDLVRWPENGWALWGLALALEKQGKTKDAQSARARFEKAWARADVKIDSTCLCLPGIACACPAPGPSTVSEAGAGSGTSSVSGATLNSGATSGARPTSGKAIASGGPR
jgi:tetratricopeptide (TPR) repeat protein